MILVGDSSAFAIESSISRVTEHALGLGYFVIHLSGRQFGVKEPDATMLANSYDEVARRLKDRGRHRLAGEERLSAVDLASGYVEAYYGEQPSALDEEFAARVIESGIVWAPDGDEAFDDASHILQIDRQHIVRLVGLVNSGTIDEIRRSVIEVEMPSADFYDVLAEWSKGFMRELDDFRGAVAQ